MTRIIFSLDSMRLEFSIDRKCLGDKVREKANRVVCGSKGQRKHLGFILWAIKRFMEILMCASEKLIWK